MCSEGDRAASPTHHHDPQPDLDALRLPVIWSRLAAIADEANATLLRTSFSPVVRESNDAACGLMDLSGSALAQSSTSIPSLLAVLPNSAKQMLERFPPASWRPGDIAITNDPWVGSGHLPDTVLLSPVYHAGKLVAFFASIAHKHDIGGQIWSADAPSLYEEGLFIPLCKLYAEGEANALLFEFIKENVRRPEMFFGDLHAQVAAAEVCARRVRDLLVDIPDLDLDDVSTRLQARSEAAMRAAIRELPDGVYRHTVTTDGLDEPLTIAVALRIQADSLEVDFTGTSAQVPRGINAPMPHCRAYSLYGLKCALAPFSESNDGSYRPISFTAPEGTIVNARRPAAVNSRHITGQYLPDAVLGALAKAAPAKVLAESGSPAIRAMITGADSSGQAFNSVFFVNGGMGARPNNDGLNCTPFPTNTSFGSVEILESASYSRILIKERALVPDSGGRGQYRGGLGQRVVVQLLSDRPAAISVLADRLNHPPSGMQGGGAASCTEVRLVGPGTVDPKGRGELLPGSEVVFASPGGGGYGAPELRAERSLRQDAINGYVSPSANRTRGEGGSDGR